MHENDTFFLFFFGIICVTAFWLGMQSKAKRKLEEDEKKEAEERSLAHQLEIEQLQQEKKQRFNDTINSLSAAAVTVRSAHTLDRKFLRDMPEIKFRNVTRSFVPEAIPSFVVIDTETTGLMASRDRITELSAILFEDFEPVSYFSTLINPKKPIPEEASDINHIYDDDVKNAPLLDYVSDSFLNFVGDCPIVGYNLAFDLKFLYCSGIDFTSSKHTFFDVLALTKKAFPDLASYKLVDVAKRFDIIFDAHASLNDCLATGIVFKRVIDEIVSCI